MILNAVSSFRAGVASVLLLGSVTLHAQTALLHYTFDEGTGTTATDSGSGPVADGTLTGNATWTVNTPNGAGSALDLSLVAGTATDYGVGATTTNFNGLSALTVTFWLNLKATPTLNDRIISNLKGGKGFEIMFGSTVTSASNFALSFGVNTTNYAVSDVNFTDADNKWAFVAISYDGTLTSSNVLFYSDSVVSTGEPTSIRSSTAGALLAPTGSILRIGSTPATANDRSPSMYLDDLRIYNSVLTVEQIQAVRLENIPEPASFALIASGCVGMIGCLRRRRRFAAL